MSASKASAEKDRDEIPVWSAYLRALEKAPVRTKSITSVVIMLAAQASAQKIATGGVKDKRGCAIWALWGLVLGVFNHQWQALIAKHGPGNLVAKIAMDHLVWKVPILYAFVTYERFLRGNSLGDSWKMSITENPAMQKVSVKVFPLIQILNFTVVPLKLRVLYMNVTLFFWCIYLSLKMRK
eukprot:TRINITY_DN4981_c0_g6_i1.p1 TRINITY_DN4981_c0_g6~~TRINITY_DN4981_c0_g6_i1.p1  ORF type:complete len:182 (+),score=28.68 TRINITY_DN4981_c0_g6_i1:65-610(+)